MKPTIAVAMSGGVDSLTAAYLLKQKGHPVIGLHFVSGYAPPPLAAVESAATPPGVSASGLDVPAIRDIGRQLEIPIHIVDIRDQFESIVIDYFVKAYGSGVTPNPCLVCNPSIKFGTLMEYAKSHGAAKMATGHYARTQEDDSGRYQLLKGKDPRKDQSYFLAFLSQEQLAHTCFPLGQLTKQEVKAIAASAGLKPVAGGESQDICFINQGSYTNFLQEKGIPPQPGPVVDLTGKELGRHQGLHRFTIGQRRGIGCPGPVPYYVVRLDTGNNRLVVGGRQDLLSTECRVTDINWIITTPETAFQAVVRIRYSHKPVRATIKPTGSTSATILFEEPQIAVTPGQGAVFYDGDHVLGGGWIKSSVRSSPHDLSSTPNINDSQSL